jgi:hypothetical protein
LSVVLARARIDREYQHVYVDLDDTLIIDGYVVPAVVSIIVIAEGKKVYLITRHEYDIHQTLIRLSPGGCVHWHLSCARQKARLTISSLIQSLSIITLSKEKRCFWEKTQCLVLDVDAVALCWVKHVNRAQC